MNVSRREGRAPQRRPQPAQRPKASKRPRRRSGPKAVFWAFYKFLVVVSALIVAVYVGASALIRPPEIPQTGNQGGQTGPVVNVDDSQEVQGRQRRDGVYNFVLLGKDVGSGNTDSITVVSYDAVSYTHLPQQGPGGREVQRAAGLPRPPAHSDGV